MDTRNRQGASVRDQTFRLGKGSRVSNVVDYGFWLSAVIVPLIVILGQACVRAIKHAPQSSATDVFSFLVILDTAIFVEREKLLATSTAGAYENLVYFIYVSTILSLIGWSFSQFLLEEKLVARHNRGVVKSLATGRDFDEQTKSLLLDVHSEEEEFSSRMFLGVMWLMAWGVSLTLFVMHVRLLAGKHLPWL